MIQTVLTGNTPLNLNIEIEILNHYSNASKLQKSQTAKNSNLSSKDYRNPNLKPILTPTLLYFNPVTSNLRPQDLTPYFSNKKKLKTFITSRKATETPIPYPTKPKPNKSRPNTLFYILFEFFVF